jgi:hypothetical protein
LGDVMSLEQIAVREIFRQYGDKVKIGRKTIHKYGLSESVTSATLWDLNSFSTSEDSAEREIYLTSNTIDSISSSDSSDTDIPISIEGMTRSGDELSFVSQTVNTSAGDGQTRVALTTPLCDCTRMRGVTTGDVYAYENTTISGGIPSDKTKVHNVMDGVEHTSLKAATSVASGNYLVITNIWASLGRTSGNNLADVRMMVSNLGDPILGDEFYSINPWSISPEAGPNAPSVSPFIIIKPNSRIKMSAQASGSTLTVFAGFSGFFADIVQ